MDKYRFDDAYDKVYEYKEDQQAYLFIGTYFEFGINSKMSKAKKIKLVKEFLNEMFE